jgi:hypothetical protein
MLPNTCCTSTSHVISLTKSDRYVMEGKYSISGMKFEEPEE